MSYLCLWTLVFAVSLTVFAKTTSSAACDFSCPQGLQKRPSGRSPDVNGCGPQGLTIDVNPLFPDFTEICNDHDRCYGTCGASKDKCDNVFWQRMKKYCESQRQRSMDFYRDCQTLSSLYAGGVKALGCSFYIDAQRQACTCTRNRSM